MADKIIYHNNKWGWGYPNVNGIQTTYFCHETGWYKNYEGRNIIQCANTYNSFDGTVHSPPPKVKNIFKRFVEFLEESGLWPIS